MNAMPHISMGIWRFALSGVGAPWNLWRFLWGAWELLLGRSCGGLGMCPGGVLVDFVSVGPHRYSYSTLGRIITWTSDHATGRSRLVLGRRWGRFWFCLGVYSQEGRAGSVDLACRRIVRASWTSQATGRSARSHVSRCSREQLSLSPQRIAFEPCICDVYTWSHLIRFSPCKMRAWGA